MSRRDETFWTVAALAKRVHDNADALASRPDESPRAFTADVFEDRMKADIARLGELAATL